MWRWDGAVRKNTLLLKKINKLKAIRKVQVRETFLVSGLFQSQRHNLLLLKLMEHFFKSYNKK